MKPRILVTLADPRRSSDRAVAQRKNELYLAAVARAGGVPLPIDESATHAALREALESMAGLLLSGGADVDPAVYDAPLAGARDTQPGRDALERDAFRAAEARSVPILGICRGLQAINAFAGGRLVQHVEGHQGPGYGEGPALQHPIEVAPGSRLASVLALDGEVAPTLVVNSYHHQGVAPDGLAPGLRASALGDHAGGLLVEGLESADPDRFLFGIQCHPERLESTPAAFERLFAAFVAAARRVDARDRQLDPEEAVSASGA